MNKIILQKYFRYVSLYLASSRSPDEALDMALKKTKDKKFKMIFGKFINDIKDGKDIADCLKGLLNLKAIDPTIYSLLLLGYRTGSLQEYVQLAYQYIEKSSSFKKKILGVLAYPATVLFASFISVLYISYVVMPKVVPVFASLKAPMPFTTTLLLGLTKHFADHGLHYFLGVGSLLVLLFFAYGRFEKFRHFIQKHQFRIPMFGTLFSLSCIQQIALSIGTLLKAHIPLSDTFTITIDNCQNRHLEDGLAHIKRHFEEGKPLSELRLSSYVLNQDVSDTLALGEATGSIPQVFMDLSDLSKYEYEDILKKITALVEPFALVVSALLVMLVALSVISPMYSLVQHVN